MQLDALAAPPLERVHDLACWALHDLRGPLRAFDATLDLMAEEDADPLTLGIGLRAARRMAATLDGLSRYADAHAAPLELAPVAPLDAVEAAWAEAAAGWDAPEAQEEDWRRPHEDARHAARGRPAAELELSPALAALPRCRADAAAFRAILAILFDNAAKYGRAAHAPARIAVDGAARDGSVRLWVRDRGPGVPRHLAGDAFEPLRRLHAQSEIEGAGLGLAIARLLAVRQGGSVGFVAVPEGACAAVRMTTDNSCP